MNQEAEKMLKNYDNGKYQERFDSDNLHELTATQIVKRIKSQNISIEALIKSYYEQYKKVEKQVGAWVEYNFEIRLYKPNFLIMQICRINLLVTLVASLSPLRIYSIHQIIQPKWEVDLGKDFVQVMMLDV